MDALPPPPPIIAPSRATHLSAPSDIYARDARETELCDRADSPDWLYLGGLLALDVGAAFVQSAVKYTDSIPLRYVGPASVGFAWGATLGGGYLSLPKCEPHWISHSPREGGVRETWPLAIAIAAIAAVTAPVIFAVESGFNQPIEWTTQERMAHVFTAGGMALAGSLLPYLLPPRTWRAARELQRLRLSTDAKGAVFMYSVRF